MKKRFILLFTLIILIAVSVALYFFLQNKNKNPAGNIVNFYCQEGNFQGEFGQNYVLLTFSDKTNLLLPQATSGSGIRYELGSTTFIGEGSNASLTIGTTTYTNCIAGNQIAKNGTNTYTDLSKTFSLSYPSQFKLFGGDFGYSQDWSADTNDLGLLLTEVYIPQTFFTTKTNFGDAKFTVGTSADPDAVKNCLVYNYGPVGTTSEAMIGGREFTKMEFTDAGAGNYYDTTSYRTIYNNQCYAVEYTIHSSNIYNYSPDQGVTEFDKAAVTSVLEGIAQSFKFIQ
jgi:membrane-bound inhibitor of C-type lysozyme